MRWLFLHGERLLSAPVIPPRWRRAVSTLAMLSTTGLVVLTHKVTEHGRALRLNRLVDERLQRRLERHAHVLEVARGLGGRDALIVGSLCLAVAGLLRHQGRAALVVLVALPASAALTERVLKPFVTGAAPTHSHPSFPSGHTTGAAALAVATLILLLPAPGEGAARRKRPLRLLLAGLVVALEASSAVAVIALGTHTTSSALGGCLVASSVVLAAALGLDAVASNIQRLRRRVQEG